MQLLRPLALAASGAALLAGAAPAVEKRQDLTVTIVESDIGGISAAVVQLTKDVQAYQGGVLAATPVLVDVGNIHIVNRKAYLDAMAPVTLNSADSAEVVAYTDRTVGQTIPNGINVLKTKKPQFTAAGLDSAVVQSLELLKSDHETYSEELLQRVSADQLAPAQAVVKKIDDAIQDGINDYAGFN